MSIRDAEYFRQKSREFRARNAFRLRAYNKARREAVKADPAKCAAAKEKHRIRQKRYEARSRLRRGVSDETQTFNSLLRSWKPCSILIPAQFNRR